jgi:CheY-like chemotaxis protein
VNAPGDAALELHRAVEDLWRRATVAGAAGVASDLSRMQTAAASLHEQLVRLPDRLAQSDGDDDRKRLRHDLRTPINQIVGYCELIREEIEDAGDTRFIADLPAIVDRARALLEHIDELGHLDFATDATIPSVNAGVPTSIEDAGSLNPYVTSGPLVLREEDEIPGTVLVVDDNGQNRDLLERRLKRDGFAVLTAADGAEALEVTRTQAVDVVLLDIMMPVMDGYETLERLKADPELRHLPVIMLTSLDEPESITRCIERGAEDHLPKPFDPVLLRARIGSSLEKKKVRDLERAYLQRILAEKRRADDLIHGVIPIGVALSAERDFNRLLERVLREARRFCGADGGALRLRHDDRLAHVLLQCGSLELSMGGSSKRPIDVPPIALADSSRCPAMRAAREGRTINVPDVAAASEPEVVEVRAFDARHGYRTRSLIAIPLRAVQGEVVGVLELWNATRATDGEVVAFDGGIVDVLESLSRLAGAAMDSYRRETELRQRIRRLEIRIDEANRRREVSEITETDYFRRLRDMAQKLRESGASAEE